jgi:hypothetical protein
MIKFQALILLITLSTYHKSIGQSAESKRNEKINLVVAELFDAYRDGDSTRVRAVFSDDAHVQTLLKTIEGEDKLSEIQSVDGFIKYIGGGFEEIHDEKLWDIQIHSDLQLGTLWTKYAFFLGEKFIHCGTETFLLRKVKGKWKIFYLVDTRQKAGCKLPEEIK